MLAPPPELIGVSQTDAAERPPPGPSSRPPPENRTTALDRRKNQVSQRFPRQRANHRDNGNRAIDESQHQRFQKPPTQDGWP